MMSPRRSAVVLCAALLGAPFGCAKPGLAADHHAAVPRADGLVAEGTVAPAFDGLTHDGQRISLAALHGQPVVLYFYPRDDTSGCTKEACEFRDAWTRFKQAGAAVIGVSTDDNSSHAAFAQKYHLPFPLLPDEHETIAKAYGVPVHGGFAKRVTFVIDRDGRVAKVFPSVNPVGHAAEILAALEALPAASSTPPAPPG